MKTHPRMETSSPQDPPSQDLQVQEEEKITPQTKKVAPTKRIRYDLTCESNMKWKFDPMNIGAI